MPPKHQHPDAHHAFHYLGQARDDSATALEAWLGQAKGAKEPDPAPVLRDL